MREIFLLRAFGDFVIVLQALLNSEYKNKYKIIASSHLEPLYLAISKNISLEKINIEFIDFKIKGSLLNFFTNRHLFNLDTFTQLWEIKKYLKLNTSYTSEMFLENSDRATLLNFVLQKKFKTIIINKNEVYSEIHNFFNSQTKSIDTKISKEAKILILPDARIKKRYIPEHILEKIKDESRNKNFNCIVANFNKQICGEKSYNNFTELINLIQESDYIVSSDSLPVHLAYLFKKPHFILYPQGGLKNFFTPYALENKFYAEFNLAKTFFPFKNE